MGRKRRRVQNDDAVGILEMARGIAGLERAEALSVGGQQSVIVRSGGVKASVVPDKKKKRSKNVCRGTVRAVE